MTILLFRDDAYLQTAAATVLSVGEDSGITLDRTNFYAAAGGQPGDIGTILCGKGVIPIATTVYADDKSIVHVPAEPGILPTIGEQVTLQPDWNIRYRNMRAHTMMHLLCACVAFPVTGGAISEDGGRIDFDIPEGQIPDKDELAAKINRLVIDNHAVTHRWITDAEMTASSHLIRTMSVKPPMGTGRVHLVMIGEEGEIDMQPCGGTHVKSTGEIGPMRVARIENKGKMNRRIRLAFA